jgi:GNAT superfamily N-acetyltransferase
MARLTVRPVGPERLDDLAGLFGTSRTTSDCYCMWFVVSAQECREGWGEGNRRGFNRLAADEPAPMGLLAYRDGEPVGWCAAGPRSRYARALRSIVLKAREPDEDAAVWLVPCFYVRRDARRGGVTRTLLEAAVSLARRRGAVAVEGFPLAGDGRRSTGEAFLGVEPLFASCGFRVVARPTPARVVMRRDLRP